MVRVLFSKTLNDQFLNLIKNNMPFRNERVFIKLHMGEPKNKNHIKPEDVKKFVLLLKELGCEPFLFDTTVIYESERRTINGYYTVSRKNGFTQELLGCPILISDLECENIKGKIEYEISKQICNASVFVLTHVKGHACAGIGSAIKNLGMGCVTRRTKNAIHEGGKPEYIGGCTCCGACVQNCPLGIIQLDNKPVIPLDKCYGCSNCTIVCPQNALKPRVEKFDVLLTEAARCALSKFKKVYFVNVLQNMARFCDCINKPLKPVIEDIGILASTDVLAIEKATYDLISKKHEKDIFRELNKKSFTEQLNAAKELNLGSEEYEMVEL